MDCLDRTEDEANISCSRRRRNAISVTCIPHAHRSRATAVMCLNPASSPCKRGAASLCSIATTHDLAPVVEPDLRTSTASVPQIHISEHGHGRGAMRSEVHLRRPLRDAPGGNCNGQRRNQQKCQRREQRQPIRRLTASPGNPLQRRQNECARHRPRNKRIRTISTLHGARLRSDT